MYVLQDVQYISGLGNFFFYVTNVFAVPKCKVSTCLAYVRPVACFTFQFVYAAFVVALRCVVGFGFGQLLQCVCTFESYLYVTLFEEVGYLSNFGTVIVKVAHLLLLLLLLVFFWVFRCIFAFSLAM